MTTFSQLVDKIALETRRPDLRADVATYLNQTLREVHISPDNGKPVFYNDNLKEDQIQANMATGYGWDIPRPQVFQKLLAVQFASMFFNAEPVWARQIQPGRAMQSFRGTWYQSGARVFFSDYGGVNAYIKLAWYEYVSSLRYYEVGARPATYDSVSGWSYQEDYDVTEETRAAARALTSNWILLRWDQTIEEGLRAKVYKRTNDTERGRLSYSLYGTLRQGLVSSESADLPGIT